MVRLCCLLLACFCVFQLSQAQQANLNLEGVVRDSATGEPVGCKIFIFTPSGKRITISSNSKDGTYLQTLSEEGKHKLALSGYNVMRKEVEVVMPASQKFKIIKQDITITKLVEGQLLRSVAKGFEHNSPQLSPQGMQAVQAMQELLRANQEMNLVMNVAPDEDQLREARARSEEEYRKQHDAWSKAVKKVKKGQPLPEEPVRPPEPADPNEGLVQERISTIKAALKDVKAGDVRIKYVSVPLPVTQMAAPAAQATPAPAAKGKKGKNTAPKSNVPAAQSAAVAPSTPTLEIRVGAVKKLYD